MTSNGIIDVCIGLVLVYLLVSILCSGIQEYFSQRSAQRGEILRKGMMQLLMDRWVYLHVINHPLVACMYRDNPGKRARPPAYIPNDVFAQAVIDIVLKKGERLGAAIVRMPGQPATFADVHTAAAICAQHRLGVGIALLPLLDTANYDLTNARKNIENWYAAMMDRASGWYKRYAKKELLWIGFLAAVVFNVDSIVITQRLFESEDLRDQMAGAAKALVDTKSVLGKNVSVATRTAPPSATATTPPAPPPAKPPAPTTAPASTTASAPGKAQASGKAPDAGTAPVLPAAAASAAVRVPASAGAQVTASGGASSGALVKAPDPAPTKISVTGPMSPEESLKVFASGLDKLRADGLPVGHQCMNPESKYPYLTVHDSVVQRCASDFADLATDPEQFGLKAIGWLITALAVCLGAPFWFDLLNKLVDIRGAGRKPAPSPAAQGA
jgi:hypothetical protein